MIAIQIIERLKFVHSKYIIHRDIKPENFIIGYDDPFIIYLIDFGLSKKYRSSRTGKHVKFSIPKRITGTARFSSLNSLRGCQVSRRDDLEAAAYVIIYLMRGGLPWENIEALNKYQKYRKIYRLKVLYTPEKLCQNLPKEMAEFLSYTRSLDFEQEPNYDYCISLFNNILIKNGTYNDLMFSWIKNPSLIKKLKNYNDNLGYNANRNSSRIYNISKRKSSPQTRIYHKIQNSFEKKRRLNSLTNTNNSLSFEDNILSCDKIFSMDINDPRIIDANDSKNTNIYCKVNSIITNESTNMNTTNRENINFLNKNYKQEMKKPTLNIYTNEISNNKIENKKVSKNNSYQKKNLNKGIYQSYSERKKYKNNLP
jgi:serine/threonine protein kinase